MTPNSTEHSGCMSVSEWVRLIPQDQIDHGRVQTRKVLLIESSLADPQEQIGDFERLARTGPTTARL